MAATSSPPTKLVIATRQSALAMWQAEHVQSRLRALYPACAVELLGMTTQGDRVLDRPLADIGGKGLFIKELEQAMSDGRADLAVHSLKDVPMDLPDGFALAAIMAREDPRDAFVSRRYTSLADLPADSVIGTSSLRREAQLRERYPQVTVKALRGNVNTRLRKLDEGAYDAIILAAAGLKRHGLAERITTLIDPADSLPAVGQGAMAIECRSERTDLIALLAALADTPTTRATQAERAFGRTLTGSCHTPLAAYALPSQQGNTMWLRGLVASRDGTRVLRGERSAMVIDAASALELGEALGADFRARGAVELLAAGA